MNVRCQSVLTLQDVGSRSRPFYTLELGSPKGNLRELTKTGAAISWNTATQNSQQEDVQTRVEVPGLN